VSASFETEQSTPDTTEFHHRRGNIHKQRIAVRNVPAGTDRGRGYTSYGGEPNRYSEKSVNPWKLITHYLKWVWAILTDPTTIEGVKRSVS